MKKTAIFLMLCFILNSCGKTDKKAQNSESVSDTNTTETTTKNKTTNTNSTNTLCKINGDPWHYDSTHGLVSRNSQTNVRTATIGFTKKLDKGSESIQLEYDVDKNVLNSVLVELKRPNTDGKVITAFYTEFRKELDVNPEARLSGSVSLSEDTRKASGNGECVLLNDDKKRQIFNPEYITIKITALNFSDISYSDTDDLKKLMNKQ